MPENTVYVGRPTRWGNPWKLPESIGAQYKHAHIPIYDTVTADNLLTIFRTYAIDRIDEDEGWLDPLRGKDLACWCKEGAPCHADILLELANRVLS